MSTDQVSPATETTGPAPPHPEPVGAAEVAAMLYVEAQTVRTWKKRKNLPTPTYASVNGSGAWERVVIVRWAGDTGRIRSEALTAEYEALGADEGPVVGLADPVGQIEIGDMFGVPLNTVHQWRKQVNTANRYAIPWPPDYERVNGSAAWERLTVLRWAGDTGRIREGSPTFDARYAEFVAAFGVEPARERRGGVVA